MTAYVQLIITGRKRDRHTRRPYQWCIVWNAQKAEAKARSLRKSRHVASVHIERGVK